MQNAEVPFFFQGRENKGGIRRDKNKSPYS